MSDLETRRAKLAASRGAIAPAKFAHVVRRTGRFQEMVSWYQTVLAATIAYADDFAAFMTYDEEHHRIAIAAVPGLVEAPPNAVGTDHVAFTYADLGDLLQTYSRLKNEGIDPYWRINHGPTLSLYYRDPDGNGVELQIDCFATAEECNAWLATDEFKTNPIGVTFDPEALLARYRAGEPLAELTKRPPLPDGASPLDMLR